ncbi:TnsA-like heteromeric transposase endonuclease subunit [Micromonospora sp. NPDC126480]|uniref:TnsA-like heteromeric transposase endonuclease subunit n=1 Tax=Micromonospora sp. NPDC126480 TaxID=3155312 RepID=UPI00332DD5E4
MNPQNSRLLRRVNRRSPAPTITYRDQGGVERTISIAEAANVPFETCQPIRRIPRYENSRHTPGRYWSATTRTLIGYESYLESKWMTLLDFDSEVAAFTGQPFRIEGRDPGDVWSHTPDIFSRKVDGSVQLIDVKNPHRLDDSDVLLQARRTTALCQGLGWEYQLVGDMEPQRWENIYWLSAFRRPLQASAELIPALLARASKPISIRSLLGQMPVPDVARPVMFHLCWRQSLVFDLDEPLRQTTLVHTSEDCQEVAE